jgi:hypothetical protein
MVTTYAFLPCAMTSSGRIHGEFLRLQRERDHLHWYIIIIDYVAPTIGTDRQ